jgi:hypothetical protein
MVLVESSYVDVDIVVLAEDYYYVKRRKGRGGA